MCIKTNQPDKKSHPITSPNAKHTTKQHAAVSIQLNSHMSHVLREVYTKQCYRIVFRLSVVFVPRPQKYGYKYTLNFTRKVLTKCYCKSCDISRITSWMERDESDQRNDRVGETCVVQKLCTAKYKR